MSELTDNDKELPEAIIPTDSLTLPSDDLKDVRTNQTEFTIAAEPTHIGQV
jgi:hypothetical protein